MADAKKAGDTNCEQLFSSLKIDVDKQIKNLENMIKKV